jgi:uncharacterized membrane protein YkgB
MEAIGTVFEKLRKTIEKKGIAVLRIAVGIIFFWFGFLKFFGNLSAAETIASKTISWLTFDQLQPEVSMPILAVLECGIGIGILTKKYMEYVIPLLYFQMAGTLLPLVIFPNETWEIPPFVPTLEGQYIIKNAVLIAAGIVLGAIAKGAKLIQDPVVAQTARKIEKQKEDSGD